MQGLAKLKRIGEYVTIVGIVSVMCSFVLGGGGRVYQEVSNLMLWVGMVVIAAGTILSVCSAVRLDEERRRRKEGGLCPTCGYDLRAHADGDRCPECGTAIV